MPETKSGEEPNAARAEGDHEDVAEPGAGGTEATETLEPAGEVPSVKEPAETARPAKPAVAAPTPLRERRAGRQAPKGGPVRAAPRTGRYTPPIPKEKRQSPRWFPWVIVGLLLLGLLMIVLNYVSVLPGGTSNGYLIGGIVLIVAGLFTATFYH